MAVAGALRISYRASMMYDVCLVICPRLEDLLMRATLPRLRLRIRPPTLVRVRVGRCPDDGWLLAGAGSPQ